MIRLPGTVFSTILGQHPIVKWTPAERAPFPGTLFCTIFVPRRHGKVGPQATRLGMDQEAKLIQTNFLCLAQTPGRGRLRSDPRPRGGCPRCLPEFTCSRASQRKGDMPPRCLPEFTCNRASQRKGDMHISPWTKFTFFVKSNYTSQVMPVQAWTGCM